MAERFESGTGVAADSGTKHLGVREEAGILRTKWKSLSKHHLWNGSHCDGCGVCGSVLSPKAHRRKLMLKVTVTSVLVDDQSCRRGGVGRFAAPSEKHLFHGGSNGMRIKANLTTLLSCLIFATPALATENTYIAAESIPFAFEAPGQPQQLGPLWGVRSKGPAGTLLKVPADFRAPIHAHTADYRAIVIEGQWKHWVRSEEHTSELQSLMRISYAVFCLKNKNKKNKNQTNEYRKITLR